jgi:hypothetical protein
MWAAGPVDPVDVYRVIDGEISEEWVADDVATIVIQVGTFNPPWGTSKGPGELHPS